MDSLIDPRGRMGRRMYAAHSLGLGAIAFLFGIGGVQGGLTGAVSWIVICLATASQAVYGARRLHDLGYTALALIWTIVPFAEGILLNMALGERGGEMLAATAVEGFLIWGFCGWLYLCIKPGEPGANRYGEKATRTPIAFRRRDRFKQRDGTTQADDVREIRRKIALGRDVKP